MCLTHEKVVTLQVSGQRVDYQNDHVALVVQEQRRSQVGYLDHCQGISHNAPANIADVEAPNQASIVPSTRYVQNVSSTKRCA